MKMIAVDIGNTNLHFAWFDNSRIIKTAKLSTQNISIFDLINIIPKSYQNNIFICSVVPRITALFEKIYSPIYIAGKNLKIPIRCLYNKNEVGMDRLVGVIAVKVIYPKIRIVLDFGTAITLDFLSASGDYQGGIILPGIGSTLKVFANCALLPSTIKFIKSKNIIPKNTKESINCGLQKGFPAMINSLIKEYKKRLRIPSSAKIIVTGGEAKIIIPKLSFACKYEPYLVLKGLNILSKSIL